VSVAGIYLSVSATGNRSINVSADGRRAGFRPYFKLLASDHDNEYMMIDATIVRAHQPQRRCAKKTARKRSASRAED